jgi:hypothetical protein
LRGVPGSRLAAVRYLVPAGGDWPDGLADGPVHEVTHGVELVVADGAVLSLMWQMDGCDEFLSVVAAAADSRPEAAGYLIDAIDVSGDPQWALRLGRDISTVRAALHTPAGTAREAIWAVRFALDGAPGFTVALGEVRDGLVRYIPDSVLVMFDEDGANEYLSPPGGTPAWTGYL